MNDIIHPLSKNLEDVGPLLIELEPVEQHAPQVHQFVKQTSSDLGAQYASQFSINGSLERATRREICSPEYTKEPARNPTCSRCRRRDTRREYQSSDGNSGHLR